MAKTWFWLGGHCSALLRAELPYTAILPSEASSTGPQWMNGDDSPKWAINLSYVEKFIQVHSSECACCLLTMPSGPSSPIIPSRS